MGILSRFLLEVLPDVPLIKIVLLTHWKDLPCADSSWAILLLYCTLFFIYTAGCCTEMCRELSNAKTYSWGIPGITGSMRESALCVVKH